MHRIPALVLVLAVMLTGCGLPLTSQLPDGPPTLAIPDGMRAATEQERVMLGKLGTLQPDAQAFAIDLIEGRVLASGFVTSNEKTTFPVMVVTDGEHVAHVSCEWNGSAALGVDTDRVGRMAIRATVDLLGQEVCESPYKPTPTPTPFDKHGKCRTLTELRSWALVANDGTGIYALRRGQIVQVAPDRWEIAVVIRLNDPTGKYGFKDGDIKLLGMSEELTGADVGKVKRYPLAEAPAALNCFGLTQEWFDAEQRRHEP